MDEKKELEQPSEEVVEKITQLAKAEQAVAEDETKGIPIKLKPKLDIVGLNRKQRRMMRFPLIMWGAYDPSGNLLTAGAFAKVSTWANNHRVFWDKVKKKFLKTNISTRPIVLTAKNAFQSPIDLKKEPFDLKLVKKIH